MQGITLTLKVKFVLRTGQKERLEKVEEEYLKNREEDSNEKNCSKNGEENKYCNVQNDQGW